MSNSHTPPGPNANVLVVTLKPFGPTTLEVLDGGARPEHEAARSFDRARDDDLAVSGGRVASGRCHPPAPVGEAPGRMCSGGPSSRSRTARGRRPTRGSARGRARRGYTAAAVRRRARAPARPRAARAGAWRHAAG